MKFIEKMILDNGVSVYYIGNNAYVGASQLKNEEVEKEARATAAEVFSTSFFSSMIKKEHRNDYENSVAGEDFLVRFRVADRGSKAIVPCESVVGC